MEELEKNDIAQQYFEKDAEILGDNGVHPKDVSEQGGGVIKSSYWKFIGGFFALLLVGFIGIPFIGNYVQEQEDKAQEEKFAAGVQYMQEMQERLKNDTDGGATAQETLALFTAALKKGDIEQANKYFVIEPKDRQEGLIDVLKNIQESGRFEEFVGYVEDVDFMSNSSSGSVAIFRNINKEGIADVSLEITKDNYSTVWKIEGLMF
ncbi:MAG: hypothetical protein UW32_C0001G0121 [Candidatus Wolfebacteria bacterium GW2011_GWE2_44_13]|uniref:DUF4878 domain-containing protein n=1 Tax=Candidatus Wolfebacteria bacterium GW2011_GWE2_44_13 TaxID=1619017 RepID=A0A0G1K6P3_9BACT|nr:MAG: hypothetical protein UW32_C0001G0121 [Candidatus Wolfebacteria bacterium GW2011_GWE2_44_13]